MNNLLKQLIKEWKNIDIKISEREADDIGIGLEPLFQEFIEDVPSLTEEQKESRKKKISSYYAKILDRSKNVKIAYEATKKWCKKVFVRHHVKKQEKQLDLFNERYQKSLEIVNENDDRIVIACDLDGVLAEYDGFKGLDVIGEPIKKVVDKLKKLKEKGAKIIIHTARISSEFDGVFNVEEIVGVVKNWLDKNKVPYDEIWQGVGKPYATHYLDDKAVKVKNGEFNLS